MLTFWLVYCVCRAICTRLLELVHTIISSHSKEVKLKIDKEPVNVRDIVQAQIRAVLPLLNCNVEMTMLPSYGKLPLVQGDSAQLSILVFAVLSASAKYTTSGLIDIGMGMDDSRHFLVIRVQSTGTNIHPDDVPSMWGLSALDNIGASKAVRRHGATALALSLAKKIAVAHGGDFEIDTTVGEACVFSVYVPAFLSAKGTDRSMMKLSFDGFSRSRSNNSGPKESSVVGDDDSMADWQPDPTRQSTVNVLSFKGKHQADSSFDKVSVLNSEGMLPSAERVPFLSGSPDTGNYRTASYSSGGHAMLQGMTAICCVEPALERFLADTLEESGVVCVFEETPDAARRVEDVTENDVFIIDCTILESQGIGLIKEIRGRGSGFPILLLSNSDGGDWVVRGLDAGADDFVQKPIQSRELAGRVARIQAEKLAGESVSDVPSLARSPKPRQLPADKVVKEKAQVIGSEEKALVMGRAIGLNRNPPAESGLVVGGGEEVPVTCSRSRVVDDETEVPVSVPRARIGDNEEVPDGVSRLQVTDGDTEIPDSTSRLRAGNSDTDVPKIGNHSPGNQKKGASIPEQDCSTPVQGASGVDERDGQRIEFACVMGAVVDGVDDEDADLLGKNLFLALSCALRGCRLSFLVPWTCSIQCGGTVQRAHACTIHDILTGSIFIHLSSVCLLGAWSGI